MALKLPGEFPACRANYRLYNNPLLLVPGIRGILRGEVKCDTPAVTFS